MLYEMLKKAYKETQCVSVYTNDTNPERFLFGRVVLCVADYFILESYAPDGKEDGWLLKEVNRVFRLETNSKYAQKMSKLMGVHSKLIPQFDAEDIVASLLMFARDHDFIVTIEILGNDCGITGAVSSVEERICSILQVDEYGNDDGVSYIDILDVTQISCHSIEEQILEHLIKKRDSGKNDFSPADL